MHSKQIIINNKLTIDEIVKISRYNYKVKLSDKAISRINNSRKYIDVLNTENKLCYGINTGLGNLCDTIIDSKSQKEFQKNILLSHACGTGNNYQEEVVRAAMVILINSIAKGYSGTSIEIVSFYIMLLNKNITPVVPEKGSLGASGDLVPLAHMALPLIGYGKLNYRGQIYESKELFKKLKIKEPELKTKDALSIINGTHFMAALGTLTIYDSYRLIKLTDCSAALTIEALNGMINNYNHKIHDLKQYQGQKNTARILNKLLSNSEYIRNDTDIKAQDAYSIRCIPQVHGATKDAYNYVKGIINTEINSVTDNPIVFASEDKVLSGGNFHGESLAISFDFLCIALAELCSITERRIERLVNHDLSRLSPFLIKNSGLNTGLMILQYVAASLVSENKILSHPASVDSIPSSANQEDHVSMGSISVRKAQEIKKNLSRIISIEMLCACQAIDLKEKKRLGKGTSILYKKIREISAFIENDRYFYQDINNIEELISSNKLLDNLESEIGKLYF